MTVTIDTVALAVRLEAALPGAVVSTGTTAITATGPDELRLDRAHLIDAMRFLRDDPETDLVFLANLTAVDRETHFEVVYHLQSLDQNHLVTVKTEAAHDDPVVPSVTPLYYGAHLQEREAFDLMGIRFEGHPDLRRMFLWDGFPGYPLRKDFLGMPGKLKAGLPGFPHEPGFNAWPVPGTGPRGGTPPSDSSGGTPPSDSSGGTPPAQPNDVPMPGGAPRIPGPANTGGGA